MRYVVCGLVCVPMVLAPAACQRGGGRGDEAPVTLEEAMGGRRAAADEEGSLADAASAETRAVGGAASAEGRSVAGVAPADNSRCLVCHINYQEEELARLHAEAGMGCVECHGESEAHSGDENNITPPEVMYPQEGINVFCVGCHGKLGDEHAALLAGTAKQELCTDCHGEHRLAQRTHRWDRRTGKLIERGAR